MGKLMEGWPDEKWVRLDSENVRRIVRGRVELAWKKGCDGVDPDNVDGYVSCSIFSLLLLLLLFLLHVCEHSVYYCFFPKSSRIVGRLKFYFLACM